MDNLSEFKADKMAAESVDGGAVDTDAAAVEVFGTVGVWVAAAAAGGVTVAGGSTIAVPFSIPVQ
jgi:hypothetical protein